MANQNYVLLERIELNQSASSVTFSNIPQTGYTDLKIVISGRDDRASQPNGDFAIQVGYNGTINTGSIYSQRRIAGSGAAVYSDSTSTTSLPLGMLDSTTATANTFGSNEVYIPNYTSSNYKSVSCDGASENNATTAFAVMNAGLISTTNPITDIKIFSNLGTNLLQYSTFSLYGIANANTTPAIAPKADGGNVIATDGTYWYHTFLTNGTFTPQVGLSCDYLVVAGGGGGGGHNAGGGGGGGLRSTVTATGGGGSLESAISVTANTAYAITVGAGGAGGADARGTAGGDSTFSTVTSIGGAGGGGSNSGQPALTGGSGGGGSQGTSGSAGTANQGYAGGASSGSNTGGGGGGAGAVGSANSSTNGGNGGNGVAVSITGTSVTYAGGGGGSSYSGSQGAAGTGGASAGQYDSAVNATANTGGGAGGRNRTGGAAGNGGSGIVIVRYLVA